ncbi:hypothetical protein [Roseibium album]|uniref:hypothetical protein n=1 Tax=Roseibium album TaxID=311410 RepID=UPI00249355A3|nr:hypothetical protein [Roseibium album]
MIKTRTSFAAVWPPTAETAEVVGHKRMSPMQAIRAKCLDCSVGQPSEVRLCEAVNCSLWPFRAGQHPYKSAKRKNTVQEEDLRQEEGSAEAATSPSHGSKHPSEECAHEQTDKYHTSDEVTSPAEWDAFD